MTDGLYETRKRPEQRRSSETVQYIIKATRELLNGSSIKSLSTNKIAKKAGVSIGTLYQYFSSKESVIQSLVEKEVNEHYVAMVQKIKLSQDLSLDDFTREILREYLSLFESGGAVKKALFRFFPKETMPGIHRLEDRTREFIHSKLKRHRDEIVVQDLALASFVIVQSVTGVLHATLAEGRKFEHEKLAAELERMILCYLKNG